MTTSHWRLRPRTGGPRQHLLDPSSEREGLDEKLMDPVGQQSCTANVDNRGLAFTTKLGMLSED